MAVIDKVHFYRVQMDIPENGDLSKCVLQVCYTTNLVDTSTGNILGKKVSGDGNTSDILNLNVKDHQDMIGAEISKLQRYVVDKATQELGKLSSNNT